MGKMHNLVELFKTADGEYIIKDNTGITIGRIYEVEYNIKSKNCMLRITFYRNDEKSDHYLVDALDKIIKQTFNKSEIDKINIVVSDDISVKPFIHLGFILEGILANNVSENNECKNELIFGINLNVYENYKRISVLRLNGKNIMLKVITPEDAEDLLNYYKRNEEYLKPFEPLRNENFYTINFQKESLEECYRQYLNGESVNFGIYKNDKFIGKIQLSSIVLGVFRSAFVGYSIDEKEQNNGYMKEALHIVCEYAFKEMGLHRIEASTLLDNVKSQRVLMSQGFNKLGISRKYLFINGEWKDHMIFYKVAEN